MTFFDTIYNFLYSFFIEKTEFAGQTITGLNTFNIIIFFAIIFGIVSIILTILYYIKVGGPSKETFEQRVLRGLGMCPWGYKSNKKE